MSDGVELVPLYWTVSGPVEVFTIALKGTSGGGSFAMNWGTFKLSTEFQVVK